MVGVDFSVWLSHVFKICLNTPKLGRSSKWKYRYLCATYVHMGSRPVRLLVGVGFSLASPVLERQIISDSQVCEPSRH